MRRAALALCVLSVACGESSATPPRPVITAATAPTDLAPTDIAPTDTAATATSATAVTAPTGAAATATPPSEREPSPRRAPRPVVHAELTTYASLLRAGRGAARQGRWPDAVRSLTAAVEASHGDGRAVGELGWALFQTGDLARATDLTSDALDSVDDPTRRAMLLYNLGRIIEAQLGYGAERAYLASLRLRPNETVRARLVALRPSALARLDPELSTIDAMLSAEQGAPSEGPCPGGETPESERDDELEGEAELCVIEQRVSSADRSLEAAIERTTSDWQSLYSLYLRVGGAWFRALDGFGSSGEGWESGRYESTEYQLRIVETARGPLVVLRHATESEDQDWCEGYSNDLERVAFCGAVGASAGCFGVVTTSHRGTSLNGRIEDLDESELSDEDRAMCGLTNGLHRATEATESNTELPAFAVEFDAAGALRWDEDAPPRLRAVTDPRALPCLLEPRPPLFACPR